MQERILLDWRLLVILNGDTNGPEEIRMQFCLVAGVPHSTTVFFAARWKLLKNVNLSLGRSKMPTAVGSDWSNFLSWLNSSGGYIFYVLLFIMVSIYLALIVFLRLARAHRLDLFPATALWFVLDLLPLVYFAVLIGSGSEYLLVRILMGIFGSSSAVALFAGVIVIRERHGAVRLPGILVWLGLGLVPILLLAIVLSSFPTVAETFVVILAIPLVAGLVRLMFTKPEPQAEASRPSG